jgi:heme ABC exporter ATP-binding subunit CcmA
VSEALVEAAGLEKRFGPVMALRGVDLQVGAGELLAVLGPNGAGKSTLLRLLAGLARPSAGRLRVGPPGGDRRAARGRVGFVGHATLVYPALSARENLRFAARLYGAVDGEARVARLLAEQELEAIADRPAATLSQGQGRRLAIARALVHDPVLLLLDEPFSGLDRAAAVRLADRLAALRAAQRALVLVTHDLALASRLADQAIVLLGGRVAHRARGDALAADALERDYLAALAAEGRAA